MTTSDEEKRATDKPDESLGLSKETLEDLDAPEEDELEAKGGAAREEPTTSFRAGADC